MALVFGPVGTPNMQVGVDRLGGTEGTSQEIIVLAVVEDPVARTVGVLQVNVWVNIPAVTFGAMVF